MKYSQTQYQSYLLRFWTTGGAADWRIMLENIATHQRHGFADLESFFDFVRTQIQEQVIEGQDIRYKMQNTAAPEVGKR